ncbi:MAG: four helix bundle protein [Deltaproteobacteria bacterium]|nr:four helix bundle protein [Deltaproteobacteria bacterium]
MLHEKLVCYRESVELADELCKEVAKWPRGFGYLSDQLRRAMASIVLNISEGNARRSNTERRRFFEISRASTAEVSSCIDLMRVFGLISQDKANIYKTKLSNISRMIWGLIK